MTRKKPSMTDHSTMDPSMTPLLQNMGFIRILESDADAGRISIEFEAKRKCSPYPGCDIAI